MSVTNRQTRKQKIELAAEDAAMENPQLERGLELVARLLLERWETKHAKTVSCKKDDLDEEA